MTSTDSQDDALVAISRVLSKVLRHEPELLELRLDEQGWVDVAELLTKLRRSKRAASSPKRLRTLPDVSYELLLEVVGRNDKSRFTLSLDGQRIRAVQGHSVVVDLRHPVVEPPARLFHGTAAENWPAIGKQGLVRGTRHAVHLSSDPVTARRVGARHGRPVVLQVDAAKMHRNGYAFSRADNGVWLVASVPPAYLSLLP